MVQDLKAVKQFSIRVKGISPNNLTRVSNLKTRGAMATEVALPDITKYPTFNVNTEVFTLVGHGKTACSFIRCRPTLTALAGGF